MPPQMFQELVSSRGKASGQWYTLPLSFVVHTSVLAALVVVPVIATDVLPTPRSLLEFVVMPAVPSLPTAPPQRVAKVAVAVPHTVPLVAPESIGVESGLVPEHDTIPAGGLEGVLEGIGVFEMAPEPPPAMAPAPADPVRLGGDIKPPVRIEYQMPDYPPIARANRVQGVVIIEAIIGVDGRVQDARILRSIPLLDQAALEAVRAWEYTPTLLNGRPTPVIMTVTVRFTLNN
jgi:periplasmic protein TonB